jgi:integrase
MPRLTASRVRGLRMPGRYSDGHGLVLHVVSSEKRYWMFRYQRAGRARLMSLGNADVLSLAEARNLLAQARALLARGVDPLDEREHAKERARPTISFSDAAERYIAAHKAGWRPRGEQHWRQSLVLHVMPHFGARPVASVSVEDVLRALTPIWVEKNPMAVIVRSRIELVLDYAEARGWRSGENPARWRGKLRHLLPRPGKVHRIEHRAALPWQEAPALFAALSAENGMASRCLAFLILTAARSSEARGCRWSEIDLDAALWTIPVARMKSGREHRVPLPNAAMAILTELYAVQTGDLVFFGNVRGRPVADTTINKMLRRLGHDGFTLHGFRSTFRDWCADAGKPGDLAEAALAHVTGSAVVRAYQRSDLLDARRSLMQAWADFLTRAAADVVPLRRMGR